MMKAASTPIMILFALSFVFNLWLAGAPDWTWLPAALAGWYLADMASGLIHLIMDYHPCRAGVGLDTIYFYEGSCESAEYQEMRDTAMARIKWLPEARLRLQEPPSPS